MNIKTNSVLVGLLAGAASAILLLASGQPSLFVVFMLAAAALPVFIAGLGWSNQASITAVLIAFVILAFVSGLEIAILHSMITLLPSAWISHLTTLARPANELGGEEDQLVWYPFPQILLHMATLVVLATVLIGWLLDYGPDVALEVANGLTIVFAQPNAQPLPPETIAALGKSLEKFIPLSSGVWVIILFAAWYFAGHIVRLSGRSKRPRDDMYISLRMPPAALFILGLGIVMMFFNGTISYIGSAIVGGIGAGFMMAGLSVFHRRTVGKVWRLMALWSVYALILLFSFSALIFAAIGLLETGKPVPLLVSKKSKNEDFNELKE